MVYTTPGESQDYPSRRTKDRRANGEVLHNLTQVWKYLIRLLCHTDYPCLVLDFDHGDIRTEPNPASLHGDFNFYIYGEANHQGDQASFNLDPLGVSASLQYTFGNKGCAEGATYDPITGPIISMAAKQPLFIVGLQQLIMDAKDGASFQQSSTSGFPATLTVSLHRPDGK